jgi:dihydroneopterin aldolase
LAHDKIQLEGMVFYGYHGVNPAEREAGQRFVVDLEVQRDLRAAGLSDDPADTVSYSDLYRLVKEVVEGPGRNLLEHVAETIARRVLDECQVDAVRVKVKKPEAPIKGSILRHAAVEIVRERSGGR